MDDTGMTRSDGANTTSHRMPMTDRLRVAGVIANTKADCTRPQATLRAKRAPPFHGCARLHDERPLRGEKRTLALVVAVYFDVALDQVAGEHFGAALAGAGGAQLARAPCIERA